jgi:hypothetical protein
MTPAGAAGFKHILTYANTFFKESSQKRQFSNISFVISELGNLEKLKEKMKSN